MTPSLLLVLAEDAFIDRQIAAWFCPEPVLGLRERCLRAWRRCRRCVG